MRRNTRRLLRELDGSDLWAVVKANGYGHGAVDVAAAALGSGASALCVVTVAEGLELRHEFPAEKIVVLGPTEGRDVALAREAGLELVVASDEIPEGVRVHLKLDTGMGRYGLAELPEPPVEVVGLMTHLATADSDPAFAREQIARFRAATDSHSHLTRHVANSAAVLRIPESRFDAARCGIALYGLSPFGESSEADGLEPALHWQSYLAQVKLLQPGESTGYGRRFVAEQPTWIGIVPVGYGDGFRRALSGTTVRVGGEPARVVGTVSMDSFAVELERELPLGAPVVIVGHGVTLDEHASARRDDLLRARDRDRDEARAREATRGGLVNDDAVRARFAANADRVAESSLRRLPALEAGIAEFVQPTGDERVLDVGTGTGPLAFALAPRVREVVGIDLVPELLERGARARGRPLSERRASSRETSPHLDVETGAFDLVCERAVLHHVPWPEVVLAEMTRATRPGGRLLVIDQLAPIDPLDGVRARPLRARARSVSQPAALRRRPPRAVRDELAHADPLARQDARPRARSVPRPRRVRG